MPEIESKAHAAEDDTSLMDDKVSISGLTQTECEHIANLENIKGNEAFKAKEYKEAVIYYTRSLSAYRMSKTLTNRALAYIKLKNYVAAVIDCNEATNMEPNNPKAFFRRGLAHKEAGIFDLAMIDFHIVLEIDPECQAAKDQLQEVEDMKFGKGKEKQKVLITEMESNDVEDISNIAEKNIKDVSKKISIQDVSEPKSRRPLLDEICDFADDQSSPHPLSKKTKDMLMVFQNKNKLNSPSLPKKVDEIKENSRTERKISITSEQSYEKVDFEPENSLKDFSNKKDSEPKFLSTEAQNEVMKNSDCFPCNQSSSLLSNVCNKIEVKENSEDNKITVISQKNKIEKEELSTIARKENCETKRISSTKKNGVGNVKWKQPEIEITPFEFLNLWSSNDANSRSDIGADILSSVKPCQLPQILTNQLDGPFLSGLFNAIDHLIARGELNDGFQYLNHLVKTPRINVIFMFLTDSEKKKIRSLFLSIESKYGADALQMWKTLHF